MIDLSPASIRQSVRSGTPRSRARATIPEDRELLAAAAALTRDLGQVRPWIYWTDLSATAAVAYVAFAGALILPFGAATVVSIVVAVLAFYRGLSFIHELTHVRRDALPGFATAWNAVFGIPLLTPSFMYDGVHTLHHSKASYGTSRDPEYLALASMRPSSIVLFVLAAALAPLGLLVRFALLAPVGVFNRAVRRSTVERFSALTINPAFRRRPPAGAFRREWIALETATSLWAITLAGLTATGVLEPGAVVAGIAIGSGVAVLNQVRTLAAHLWENETGEPVSLTEQYLDSVNVPPPAALPALWAPVGLRYHGLHHLLPSIPYHGLAEAHRRLTREFGENSTFDRADHPDLLGLIKRILHRTSGRTASADRPGRSI